MHIVALAQPFQLRRQWKHECGNPHMGEIENRLACQFLHTYAKWRQEVARNGSPPFCRKRQRTVAGKVRPFGMRDSSFKRDVITCADKNDSTAGRSNLCPLGSGGFKLRQTVNTSASRRESATNPFQSRGSGGCIYALLSWFTSRTCHLSKRWVLHCNKIKRLAAAINLRSGGFTSKSNVFSALAVRHLDVRSNFRQPFKVWRFAVSAIEGSFNGAVVSTSRHLFYEGTVPSYNIFFIFDYR